MPVESFSRAARAFCVLLSAVCSAFLLVEAPVAAAQTPDTPIEILRDDVLEHPSDVYLLAALAEAELEAGNPAAAVRHFESLAERAPSLAREHSTSLGIAYHRAGEPRKAMRVLAKEIERVPTNVDARIHYALALEDVGAVAAAAGQWATLRKQNADLAPEIELLRGLAARRRGDEATAAEHLNRAIEFDFEGWVTARAEQALANTGAVRPAGPSGFVRTGFEFDSNVTQESSSTLPDAPTNSEDGRAVIGLDLAWRGLETEHAPRLAFDVGYAGRQTLHFDLGELNRQIHAPYVAAIWRASYRATFSVDALYSFELLGSDSYRHAVGLQPSFRYVLGPRAGQIRAFAWGRRDDFVDTPARSSLERDGFEVGGGLQHAWSPHKASNSWMRVGFSYAHRFTEAQRDFQGFESAYDGGNVRGWLEAGVTLPYEIRARGSLVVSHGRYENRSVLDRFALANPAGASKRRDRMVATWLGFTRAVHKRIDLEIGWSYRDRDSNLDVYRFHGHVVGATLHTRLF